MPRNNSRIVAAAVVIGVLVSAAAFMARTLPSSTLFPSLRRAAQFFFPPDDLFSPLAVAPLEVSSAGAVEFEFEHRYPGLHTIDLDIPGPVPTGAIEPGLDQIVLNVNCRDARGHEIAGVRRSGVPYWREGGSGISILTYEVPDELAYRGVVRCRIVPLPSWASLPDKSPSPPRIVVKKYSAQ